MTPKPQANTHKNLKYEILAALECDKDCGDKVDTDTCFDNQVERVETLLQEARADERQAMLDMPELQYEKEDLMDKWTPEMSAVITETRRIIYGRNALRAEIRTAIKKRGE